MIFASVNEQGEPAWKLVLEGRKTVTRRTKPQPVGAVRAVQPGRGKKAVGYVRILSCVRHDTWYSGMLGGYGFREPRTADIHAYELALREEAMREGFDSWAGLWGWLLENYGEGVLGLYRIEFELVKKVNVAVEMIRLQRPIIFECLCCTNSYYREAEEGEDPDGWFIPNWDNEKLAMKL